MRGGYRDLPCAPTPTGHSLPGCGHSSPDGAVDAPALTHRHLEATAVYAGARSWSWTRACPSECHRVFSLPPKTCVLHPLPPRALIFLLSPSCFLFQTSYGWKSTVCSLSAWLLRRSAFHAFSWPERSFLFSAKQRPHVCRGLTSLIHPSTETRLGSFQKRLLRQGNNSLEELDRYGSSEPWSHL